MTGETEAAADVLTGAIVAGSVEPQAGMPAVARPADVHTACRNCGAVLHGAYCSACGQAAHLHRTLASLGHDILHAVFHFEGKLWRTLPELAWNPGRLTRRYIDGERAKFVSPMALYLFSVFLMYAVFGFTGGPAVDTPGWSPVADIDFDARGDPGARIENLVPAEEDAISSAAAEPDSELSAGVRRLLERLKENPSLVAYKVKANGYKYAWALVPLSVPFVWLLFLRRREFGGYDHAVFVTYSISFMMLWFVLLSVIRAAWPGSGVLSPLLQFVPPIHMYRQLRGTYGLSVAGALVRLFFLLIAAAIVLATFVGVLLVLGLLG
jgi:hypothetical protein